MAGVKEKRVLPYPFTADVERAVAALVCESPRFYARVGRELDADAMPTPTGQLAIKAAQAAAGKRKRGPGGTLIVLQRIKRWIGEGVATLDELTAVDNMVSLAEDMGLPDADRLVDEVAPIMRRHIHSDAVRLAMDEYGKRKDLAGVVKEINRGNRVGVAAEDPGTRVGDEESLREIRELRSLQRLPTGISDLDVELAGGLPRGQLGVFIGGAGGGKSMCLSHLTSYAARGGALCAYATLELPKGLVIARIIANRTGELIDDIARLAPGIEAKILACPLEGACFVAEFTPQVTTAEEITSWVKQLEEDAGRGVDLLAIDYADKLAAPGAKGDKTHSYQAMGDVYEELRIWAHEHGRWCWTASQASRVDRKKTKKLDLENVADSMNKVRVADLIVTLNPSDSGDMTFFVAKNRTGRARTSVGPVETDFGRGAVAPVLDVHGQMDLLAKEVARGVRDEGEGVPF